MGMEVPGGGVNFPRKILQWGNLPRFLYKNYFYLSYFLSADSILHVEILRRTVQGKYLPCWDCVEYLSVCGGGFSAGEILHGGVFHGINSPVGIFCGSIFLLGGGGCL